MVQCLEFFDGEKSELDLRAFLVRSSGQLDVGGLVDHLEQTLSKAGFLEDEAFARLKEEKQRAFAEAPVREPVHAGSGYPDDPAELTATFAEYMRGPPGHENGRMVRGDRRAARESFWRGGDVSGGLLGSFPDDADKTFVILGTSHYGQPDRFGLTRKPFVTPLGETLTDLGLVERLEREAPGAIAEDYCHAVEHSIEFQVVFLQHLFGPRIKVVPILCGSYARSLYRGREAGGQRRVRRALGTLGDIAAKESARLRWVLGVDMAHMGARYGDQFEAKAEEREMVPVRERDLRRIAQHGSRRRAWLLGPGAGESRRSEMVRVRSNLYVFEGCTRGQGQALALSPVEYRRTKRGQFWGARLRVIAPAFMAEEIRAIRQAWDYEIVRNSIGTRGKPCPPRSTPSQRLRVPAECYALALRSAADYVVELDPPTMQDFQTACARHGERASTGLTPKISGPAGVFPRASCGSIAIRAGLTSSVFVTIWKVRRRR